MFNVVSIFLMITVSGTKSDLIPGNPQRWDHGINAVMSLILNLMLSSLSAENGILTLPWHALFNYIIT